MFSFLNLRAHGLTIGNLNFRVFCQGLGLILTGSLRIEHVIFKVYKQIPSVWVGVVHVSESLDVETNPSFTDPNEHFVIKLLDVAAQLASEMNMEMESADRLNTANIFLSRLALVKLVEQVGECWTHSGNDLDGTYIQTLEAGDSVSETLILPLFEQLASTSIAAEPSRLWIRPAYCEYFSLNPDERRALIALPNEAWVPILGPNGLLTTTSFSVTDGDASTHVTPLALGRLLELKLIDRVGTGTYYTPPVIVRRMVRRSLVQSVCYHLGEELSTSAKAWLLGESAGSDLIHSDEFSRIQTILAEMKILDPAAGSGAYLVGVAEELARLRVKWMLDDQSNVEEGMFHVLHHIVKSNLYGVDLNEEAILLTRVRLWLWLMHQLRTFTPMPPLQLNIISGDSVSGLDVQFNRLAWEPQHPLSGVDTLLRMHEQYLHCPIDERSEGERLFYETLRTIKSQIGIEESEPGIIYQLQFPSIFRSPRPGFSIVLANPPYVRAEYLPEEYKALLQHRFNNDLFQPLSSTTDLYCAFFAKSFRLLEAGGVQAFLCSNSWMDVDYGVGLKKLLLNYTVIELLDVSGERTFRDAAVNTVVSVVQKVRPEADSTTYLTLLTSHDDAWTNPESGIPILQSAMEAEEKWTLYLHGNDSFRLYERIDGLTNFSKWGIITRGFTSGANDFFFIKAEMDTPIEPQFLHPLIKSPKEITGLVVNENMLTMQVFVCREKRSEIEASSPGASNYILQGERDHAYHELPTTSSRKQWYALPMQKPSHILLRQFYDKVFDFPMNPSRFFTDHTFYYISLRDNLFEFSISVDERARRLAAFLNSTVGWLLIESVGRKNMGDGVLTCYGPEFNRMKIPPLGELASVVDPFMTLTQRPVESVFDELGVEGNDPKTFKTARSSTRADRRALDDAVFDVIGFDEDQRERWYTDFLEAISQRLSKAKKVL